MMRNAKRLWTLAALGAAVMMTSCSDRQVSVREGGAAVEVDTIEAARTESAAQAAGGEETTMAERDPATKPAKTETAMFGAGCFWGVELRFQTTPGVLDTSVGFAGGQVEKPTYEQVCYTDTGHAEVVHLTYDPSQVSYEELLQVFFENHDPTQLNRQGPDVGEQYRSVVFYYGDAQREAAEKAKRELEQSGKHKRPIVTQIVAAPEFYPAEEYHQDYLKKRGVTSCGVPGAH